MSIGTTAKAAAVAGSVVVLAAVSAAIPARQVALLGAATTLILIHDYSCGSRCTGADSDNRAAGRSARRHCGDWRTARSTAAATAVFQAVQ
ncbi:exported hypothetical protein [Rhodococcus sp. RD6.2]|nr:exported hypothetical protein [Rhodococcus sp. RD6.2]